MTTRAIFIVLGVIIAFVVFYYNKFITIFHRAEEAWADIDVQLKRRYDLIPNLVNTVKGFAAQESKVFETVTNARAVAMGAKNLSEKREAENSLSGALKTLFAVSEAYPDLKSNQNFLELQKELSDTENKIQAARRFYNGNVRDLNIAVNTVPGNIIAKFFGFAEMEFFALNEEEAKEPVEVKF